MPADLDTAVYGGVSSQHYGLRNSFGLPASRHKLDWIDANVADGDPDDAGLKSITSRKRDSNFASRDRGEHYVSFRPASIYEDGGASKYLDQTLSKARQEVRRQTPGRVDGNLRASQLQLDALSEIRASRSLQHLLSTREESQQIAQALDNRRVHALGDSMRLNFSRGKHSEGLGLGREQEARLRRSLTWSLSNEEEEALSSLPARISASVSDPERDAALTRLAQSLIQIGKIEDGEDILRAINQRNDPRSSHRASLRKSWESVPRPDSIYAPPYRPGSIAGLDEHEPRMSAVYEYRPKVIPLESRQTTRMLEEEGLVLPSSDPLILRTPMEELFDRLYGNRGNMQGELDRERISARLDTVELVNAKWGNRMAALLGSREPASRVFKANEASPNQAYTDPHSYRRTPPAKGEGARGAGPLDAAGGRGKGAGGESGRSIVLTKAATRGWDNAMRLSKLLEETEGLAASAARLRSSPPKTPASAHTAGASGSVGMGKQGGVSPRQTSSSGSACKGASNSPG